MGSHRGIAEAFGRAAEEMLAAGGGSMNVDLGVPGVDASRAKEFGRAVDACLSGRRHRFSIGYEDLERLDKAITEAMEARADLTGSALPPSAIGLL